MGHSSIQVTVDIYGHLIPGANILWVDRLDLRPSEQQSATEQQQDPKASEQEVSQISEKTWLPPRDSNPDMLIQSPPGGIEGEENKALSSAKSSKVLQNSQQNSNSK